MKRKLLYIIFIVLGLVIAGTAYAVNVTVPQATQLGDLPTGKTSGNYQLLHPGADGTVLSASSTATNGLAWINQSGGGSSATTTITAGAQINGPNFTFASSSDTNLALQMTASGSTVTFTPQWLGTLAAARLNSNVVQGVTNDTNVTGSISSQNLTLGWSGLLSVARGGTGAPSLTANDILFGNGSSPVATSSSLTWDGTKFSTTNASTSAISDSGQLWVTGSSTLAGISGSNLFDTSLTSCTNGVITSAAGLFGCNGSAFLTGNQNITLTGDVTGSGATSITTTYNNVVPANKGGTGTSTTPTLAFGQILQTDSTGSKYAPSQLVNSSTFTWTTSTPAQLSLAVVKVPNAVTFNNGGSGASSGQTFDGSAAATISYNTIGAQAALSGGLNGEATYWTSPSALAASASLLTNGTVSGINATDAATSLLVKGNAGNFIPLNVTSSTNTSLFTVARNGNIGINTSTPTDWNFEVFPSVEASTTEMDVAAYSFNGTGVVWRSYTARGTPAAPSSISQDDTLFDLGGNGWGGTAWSSGTRAKIGGRAAQAWTGSNQGTYLRFLTTPLNSTSIAEVMRIDPAGNVGIGTTAPLSLLTVQGTANITGSTTLSNLGAGCVASTATGALYIGAGSCAGGGGGTPGGSNTNIQYNNSGAFGGASWDVLLNTQQLLGVNTSTPWATFSLEASTSAQTLPILVVASTSHTSMLKDDVNGLITIQGSATSTSSFLLNDVNGNNGLLYDNTTNKGSPGNNKLTVASSTGASLVTWNGWGNQILNGNGMIYGSSTAPTLATSTGAGTGSTYTITGGNAYMAVTINTAGTAPTANAVIFTISPTNNNPSNKLICTYVPANANAATTTTNSNLVYASSTASQWALVSQAALTNSLTYKWNIACGGY